MNLPVLPRALPERTGIVARGKRPYVILKWAQTKDGFIARADYTSKWISGEESRELVHLWRSEEGAVLVGARTVLVDNPLLTPRGIFSGSAKPLRVALFPRAEPPETLALFSPEAPTLFIVSKENEAFFRRFSPAVDVAVMAWGTNPARGILDILYQRGIESLIVEGGAHTFGLFLSEGFWDEARVFTSQSEFGAGVKAPFLGVKPRSELQVGKDTLSISFPRI